MKRHFFNFNISCSCLGRAYKHEKFGTQLTPKSTWNSEIVLQPKPPKATGLSGFLGHGKTSMVVVFLTKVIAVATASQQSEDCRGGSFHL